MEDEIEEKLQEIYNKQVRVKFRKYGTYDIFLMLNEKKVIAVCYMYDGKSTFELNIQNIIEKLDNEIIKVFRKEEE